MKLILEMKCEKIPVANQMLGVSLIKYALSNQSSEYVENLYLYGLKSNKNTKNFSFSIRAFDYKLEGEEIYVNGKVLMIISSPDQEFILRVYNGLVSNRKIKYKNYELNLNKMYTKLHKKISREEAVFKTISPIFIKDKYGNGVSIEDSLFEEELNYISNKVLLNYRGYGLSKKLEFRSVDMKKRVIKLDIREFNNRNKQIMLNAYEGIFKLNGCSNDLCDLNQLGIGFRRGQGFGSIELL